MVRLPEAAQYQLGSARLHVEQEFVKRKRDRANPEALARRGPLAGGDRK